MLIVPNHHLRLRDLREHSSVWDDSCEVFWIINHLVLISTSLLKSYSSVSKRKRYSQPQHPQVKRTKDQPRHQTRQWDDRADLIAWIQGCRRGTRCLFSTQTGMSGWCVRRCTCENFKTFSLTIGTLRKTSACFPAQLWYEYQTIDPRRTVVKSFNLFIYLDNLLGVKLIIRQSIQFLDEKGDADCHDLEFKTAKEVIKV